MERSSRQKEQYNASAKQKEKKQTVSHGKQSLKKLAENGAQLSNIEVTDGNINLLPGAPANTTLITA